MGGDHLRDAIGVVAEVIAAIGVIITLIYVAIQIRESTVETRILQTQNLVAAHSDANYMLATNTEMAEIVRTGLFDREGLSDADKFRFNVFFFAALNRFDFAYHQYKSNRLEEKFWEKMAAEIPIWLNLPGGADWWAQDKSRFSPEFVAYVEKRCAGFKMPDLIPTVANQPNGGTN